MMTVIIPVLNEEKHIAGVVNFAKEQPNVSEVIVVDDKSMNEDTHPIWPITKLLFIKIYVHEIFFLPTAHFSFYFKKSRFVINRHYLYTSPIFSCHLSKSLPEHSVFRVLHQNENRAYRLNAIQFVWLYSNQRKVILELV